jgi:hypothetical protein
MCPQGYSRSGATPTEEMDRKCAALFSVGKETNDVEELNAIDVFCGRDKMANSHSGNKFFRQLVSQHRERYQSASLREEKTRIISYIIDIVHSHKGRFVKFNQETGQFYEAEVEFAKDKVSHALRSAKDPDRPRPTRKRPIRVDQPTAAEEEAFQRTLAAQEKFYSVFKA